ncbi:TPA: ChbG/HpnK family deacetylase [Candidatus Poribacteria bacterium]|nr:ChbG/HpnK family deacetylase [Candidatus Poribacteria bacterium]
MMVSLTAAVCLLSVMPTGTSAENLAERLGYPSDARLLIIHADDVGMCHSVNEATMKALEAGIVTSGSIMVPCPWFPEIAAYCREHPQLDLGIHVTLTSEWKYYRWRPASPMDQVPGLVDEEGYLWRSVEDVVKHASPEEVEREIRAQIRRAIDFGIKPTHIDTHMGTVYASPHFFKAYCKVAEEFGIPPMILSPNSDIARRRAGEPVIASIFGMLRSLNLRFPMLDDLVTGVATTEIERRREEYKEVIRNLKPGVTQVILHLGLDRPEMRAITSSWLARYNDFLIFTDEEMRRFIEEQGVKLIGWKEIKALGHPGR